MPIPDTAVTKARSTRAGRVVLAAVGDATDPATFSGTPYYCLQAGMRHRVVDAGLRLDATGFAWRSRRVLWNLNRAITSQSIGGYQYSEAFQKALWRQDPPGANDTVISMFQLVSRSVLARPSGELWFWVDQSLSQLFEHYGLETAVPEHVQAGAMALERAQYQVARGVIAFSGWAAQDIVTRYQVPEDRVHTIICGANLDETAVGAWEKRTDGPTRLTAGSLRMVFIGKDWQRKGLDRLIRGMAIARKKGASAELIVIGVSKSQMPSQLAGVPGVQFEGFVNKHHRPVEFIDIVSSCHVGCLLSRAEATGMSLREFGRLGLPTIAPLVGGAPEYVVEGATHLVPPTAGDEEVGAIIYRLATDRALLAKQQDVAWRNRESASWDRSIETLARILGRERKDD